MKTGRDMNKWTGPENNIISDLSNNMNFKKIPINKTNLDVQVCVCVFDSVGEGEFFIIRGEILTQL